MKGNARSQSGKKPIKGVYVSKERKGFRKVHIDGEAWQWKYGGQWAKVFSPTGELYFMRSRYCEWGGKGDDPITPGEVKEWILANRNHSSRVYPKKSSKSSGPFIGKKKSKCYRIAYQGRLIEIQTLDPLSSKAKASSYVVKSIDGSQFKGKLGHEIKTVGQLSKELIVEFRIADTSIILEAIAEGVDECFIGCI
jgi:hypothetical protein